MAINLGLTDAQLLARRSALGGSDAPKIMAGGKAWADLWLDKTGRIKPKAVMSEWDSALRHASEKLQIEWYGHKTGHHVGRQGEIVSAKEHPIIRATLDGYDITDRIVLQAKHVSEWTQDPINWCVEHYAAQVTHEMIASSSEREMLLIIVGMKQPEWVSFTIDPFVEEAYLDRCHEFWRHVETDTPPDGAEPMPPPIPLEDMRSIDFNASNSFASFAADWLASKDAAKVHDDATTGLKKLIPVDCREGFGMGVTVVRNKAGSLTVKAQKEK